jgi:class 3 adenylate cyclase
LTEHLDKYKSFSINEADEKEVESKEQPKRSERVLNQAQKEWDDEQESGIEKTENMPTMLFSDVVGSSKMWSDDPLSMSKQLLDHHELVNNLSEKYGGWVVKTIGDAFMVYFESSDKSLVNALKFSKDLTKLEKKYKLRIGVCSGNMEARSYRLQKVDLKDFFGNAVNTASRMESKVSDARGVAFTSVKPISKKLLSIIKKEVGNLDKADLSKIDLKGVTVDAAYKMKFR